MAHQRWILGAVLGVVLAAAPARAQKVYVNGVDCTGLVGARFEGATVTFDEQGNIRIDAPGYRVQVIQPAGAGGAAATPGTTTTTTTTTTSGGSTTRTTAGGGQTVVYSDSGRAMTTGTASYNPPIVEQTTTTVVTTTTGGGAATSRTTGTGGAAAATGTAGGTPATTAPTTTAPATPPARAAGSSAPTKQYFLITQGTGGAAVGETVQVNINGRTVRTLDSAAAQVIVNVTDWLNVGGNSVTMLSTKKQNYVAGSSSSTFQVIVGEGHVEAGGQVVIDIPLVTYTRTAADATANSRTFNLTAR